MCAGSAPPIAHHWQGFVLRQPSGAPLVNWAGEAKGISASTNDTAATVMLALDTPTLPSAVASYRRLVVKVVLMGRFQQFEGDKREGNKAFAFESEIKDPQVSLTAASPARGGGGASPPLPRRTVDGWLADLELDRYAAAIKERGYDALRFVADAEGEDMEELAREVEMRPPHARTLLKAWARLAGAV